LVFCERERVDGVFEMMVLADLSQGIWCV
jgi:hypothetical protein